MVIAMICDVLGEANNGTVIATTNLINHLRDAGHTVYVVSTEENTSGHEDYYVTPTLDLGFFINKIIERNGVSLAKADPEILGAVIDKADVVHLEVPFPMSFRAVKIAKEKGKPITASFHCQAENVTAHIGLMNVKRANRLIYKTFYKNIYQYCDVIHFPTEFIRSVFYETTPIDRPYRVISNGVNDAFFAPFEEGKKNDKFTIISTGRYSKEKDQSTLIRAIGKSRYRDNIHLILAGEGPDEKKLMRLAKRKNVDAEFRFFSREQLLEALHTADLYVHPAVVEIEAIGCIEAIATGLVAIISDSDKSATRFFALDDNTLFKAQDPNDLCKKIEYFYENPNEIDNYKEKYAAMRKAFDQKSCMEEMEEMLQDAAGGRFRA